MAMKLLYQSQCDAMPKIIDREGLYCLSKIALRLMLSSALGAMAFILMGLQPGNAMAECIEPMALWKLEETETTTEFQNEMNPGSNVGTCRQVDSVSVCPQADHGRYGTGQRFYADDRPTGIDIPSSSLFNWQGIDSFSISFWMKRDSAPLVNNEVIVGRDPEEANGGFHWWIGVHKDGTPWAHWKDQNQEPNYIRRLSGDNLIIDNRWHYIVFVRDGGTSESRLFVDGVLEDKMVFKYDAANAFSADATPLNIGWLNLTEGYHYKGVLDEVAIYDIALPQWFIFDRYHADERYSGDDQTDPCEDIAGQ